MNDNWQGHLKLTGLSLLVLVALIIILQNTGPVETRLLWLKFSLPQAFLLLLTAGAGFGAGVVTGRYYKGKRKIGRDEE